MLVICLFFKFFKDYLQKFQEHYKKDPSIGQRYKQSILRSLYSLGLFSKNFDVDKITSANDNDTGNEEVHCIVVLLLLILVCVLF